MKAKIHKLEILVIDTECNLTREDIIAEIENSKHSCPCVLKIQSAEIDWEYNHPINYEGKRDAELDRIFNPNAPLNN